MIEKDSGCQLLGAMDRVHDARVKAQLFQHVLEEFHHADLFERACAAYSNAPLEIPVITRQALVEGDGPQAVVDFVSYVHVGESAVNADFEAYAKSSVDPRIQGVFKAVRMDEANHEEDSMELLESIAGGKGSRLRWSLLKSRAKRGWRSYVLVMRGIGEIPLAVLLSILYFVAGPFVFKTLQRRLELAREEQLKILLVQLERTA